MFQSSRHGYDTIDYYHVDRRLGDNGTLERFADAVHQRGMRLVLDAVLNHVGRQFWAFEDIIKLKQKSDYRDWFKNLRFDGRSPAGDPFQYESWQGHYSLVNLNLSHPHVRAHLLDAVGMWMDRFGIDGLRLDAADCIDLDFLRTLRDFTKARRADFWLMGEIVHGDYRKWANPETLDTVTNYETYKSLYSSLVEDNYLMKSLMPSIANLAQMGYIGIFGFIILLITTMWIGSPASCKTQVCFIRCTFCCLPCPIPSIYYGSEWGIKGQKEGWSDAALRPALDLGRMRSAAPQPDLAWDIQRLAALRKSFPALRLGDYRQVLVNPKQLVFQRQFEGERMIIALNSDSQSANIDIPVDKRSGAFVDVLHDNQGFEIRDGSLQLHLPARWGRVLLRTQG